MPKSRPSNTNSKQQGASARGRLVRWVVGVLLAGVSSVLGGVYWLYSPMAWRVAPEDGVLAFSVPQGAHGQRVVREAVAAGLDEPVWLLMLFLRASGQAERIKAGSYELDPATTPLQWLDKLVRGEQALRSVTLLEGWNLRQVRAALAQAPNLKPDSAGLGDAELARALALDVALPEGRLFPDTYSYPKGSSDLEVLRQAAKALNERLDRVWAQRQPGLPLKSPTDALILASIVEKETGREADRSLVAGVFINRLRLGMRLQTDPTVIYGAGPDFDGRLRRRHLDTDTPYNTYTRAGLPPTPIAMPSQASLMAAVQPAETQALYFVARGDGSSEFSATLTEHNRAVRRYILRHP